MLFTSLQYLLFLPIVVTLFWFLPGKARLPMLLIASYYFYMCFEPLFILLIVSMTVFNFFWGNLLAQQKSKLYFWIGISVNLLCLGFFKYSNLILQTINQSWHADIILPLAISFFVFEFIHYLCEVYKGNSPVKSFVLFSLFAAFFPTQIAGPIKRYKDFEAQLQEEKKFSIQYFEDGVPLIILGMAKKVLLANNLATFVDMGYSMPQAFTSADLWLLAYAFAFQIYFDFSAYTDIARGSAMLFGYQIPINFNLPYIANNISNFWHRWHISLSTWLRDYLFIPLGGSKGSRFATNRNLFITMALGGLWHGASWSFVVWGIYHGLALIIHREFTFVKERMIGVKNFLQSKWGNALSIFFTFHVVVVGWVFFRVHELGAALNILSRMFVLNPSAYKKLVILEPHLPLGILVTLAMVLILLATNWILANAQEKKLLTANRVPAPLKGAFCAVLLILMIIFLPSGKETFIYFQF